MSGVYYLIIGYPPFPHPPQSLESLGWAWFGPQNLDVKELTGQNLESKGVADDLSLDSSEFFHLDGAAIAWIIMGEIKNERKVRCHKEAVENFL